MRLVLVTVIVAACSTPDNHITFAVNDGPAQSCGSTNCANVHIPCDAIVSIRIVDPDDQTAPLKTKCEPLPPNRNMDLCAISSIDIADMAFELPKKTLDVQIAIWPRADAIDPETGLPDCGRHEVHYDAVYGFPVAQQPAPAIGGHAFYHPGDSETRVLLGCTDLLSLSKCSIDNSLDVTATVESFENLGVLVSVNEGSRFKVDVGEPKLEGTDTVYSLASTKTRSLALTVVGVVPIWRGNIDLDFAEVACVQVLEDSAQATASVFCTRDNIPPPTNSLELRGVQFPKATLDQILSIPQLALSQFPKNGLTIGIVVDSLFNPIPGQVVSAPGGTIKYVSADRMSVGGTMTTSSGIFISLDAPFGTQFSAPGSDVEVGGQIQGRVTVVVLQK